MINDEHVPRDMADFTMLKCLSIMLIMSVVTISAFSPSFIYPNIRGNIYKHLYPCTPTLGHTASPPSLLNQHLSHPQRRQRPPSNSHSSSTLRAYSTSDVISEDYLKPGVEVSYTVRYTEDTNGINKWAHEDFLHRSFTVPSPFLHRSN